MSSFREVRLSPRSANALLDLIGPGRVGRFRAAGEALAGTLSGRTVWNVTLDDSATGVGELVRSVLGYVAGFGIATQWLVLEPDARLRPIARWVRDGLQGLVNDTARLGPDEHAAFREALAAPAEELAGRVRPGDLVLLHDPGPAGLAAAALGRDTIVVWRCHAGSDSPNASAERSWAFLQPYLEDASGFVFSRPAFVPAWIGPERTALVAPSIDPLAPKNRPLTSSTVQQVLTWAGLLAGEAPDAPGYTCTDGTEARMRNRVNLIAEDGPPAPGTPVVAQITRWVPPKDMPGVLAGFAAHVTDRDAHLILAGPDPTTPEADPIAAVVFEQCRRARAALPEAQRRRIHLAALPADADESAIIVNALQRHAAVIVQKSIAGDQSTAVSEAMFKACPIVASGVGGIRDQIRDHRNGLLVGDPADLAGFGAAVTLLLTDTTLARELRYTAYEDAVTHMLPDRHLLQWAPLVSALVEG